MSKEIAEKIYRSGIGGSMMELAQSYLALEQENQRLREALREIASLDLAHDRTPEAAIACRALQTSDKENE